MSKKQRPFFIFIEQCILCGAEPETVSEEIFHKKFIYISETLERIHKAIGSKKIILESRLNQMFFNLLDDMILSELSYYYMKMLIVQSPWVFEEEIAFKYIDIEQKTKLPLIHELLCLADMRASNCEMSSFLEACITNISQDKNTILNLETAKKKSLRNLVLIEKSGQGNSSNKTLLEEFKKKIESFTNKKGRKPN